jgi:hypothetical protein
VCSCAHILIHNMCVAVCTKYHAGNRACVCLSMLVCLSIYICVFVCCVPPNSLILLVVMLSDSFQTDRRALYGGILGGKAPLSKGDGFLLVPISCVKVGYVSMRSMRSMRDGFIFRNGGPSLKVHVSTRTYIDAHVYQRTRCIGMYTYVYVHTYTFHT